MAFESLSETYEIAIENFPSEWLPLTYLYDPDLPLFPIQYFHILDPKLAKGHRPGERDRLFGFIHHINLHESDLSVTVIINKDVNLAGNAQYIEPLKQGESRLGLGDPVTLSDIRSPFSASLANSNKIVEELWYKVIDGSFGKSLPFGKMWDPVYGLVRFIASWNSAGGRKGELIQTHSFLSGFGVKIQTGNNIHVDFYLLPTFEELSDKNNPLNIFPRFADLANASEDFAIKYCETKSSRFRHQFSSFSLSKTNAGSKLKTSVILKIIEDANQKSKRALFDNYSAFDRGPQRSIISLMMFNDLRNQLWNPATFTPAVCGEMYAQLKGTYQTPKVIQLYAQQCFGSKVCAAN